MTAQLAAQLAGMAFLATVGLRMAQRWALQRQVDAPDTCTGLAALLAPLSMLVSTPGSGAGQHVLFALAYAWLAREARRTGEPHFAGGSRYFHPGRRQQDGWVESNRDSRKPGAIDPGDRARPRSRLPWATSVRDWPVRVGDIARDLAGLRNPSACIAPVGGVPI